MRVVGCAVDQNKAGVACFVVGFYVVQTFLVVDYSLIGASRNDENSCLFVWGGFFRFVDFDIGLGYPRDCAVVDVSAAPLFFGLLDF